MVATQLLDVRFQQHWFAEYMPVGTLTETVSLTLILSEVEIHSSLQDQASVFWETAQGDLEHQNAIGSGVAAKTSLKLSYFSWWREKQLLWAGRARYQQEIDLWELFFWDYGWGNSFVLSSKFSVTLLTKLSANTCMFTKTLVQCLCQAASVPQGPCPSLCAQACGMG